MTENLWLKGRPQLNAMAVLTYVKTNRERHKQMSRTCFFERYDFAMNAVDAEQNVMLREMLQHLIEPETEERDARMLRNGKRQERLSALLQLEQQYQEDLMSQFLTLPEFLHATAPLNREKNRLKQILQQL
jgi:hypothetical protein